MLLKYFPGKSDITMERTKMALRSLNITVDLGPQIRFPNIKKYLSRRSFSILLTLILEAFS